MNYASKQFRQINYAAPQQKGFEYISPVIIGCDWKELRAQLMLQWPKLVPEDLDKAGPNRHRIALLIERKYGISSDMIENYLCNFERTIPVATAR